MVATPSVETIASSTASPRSTQRRRLRDGPPFKLIESKLHPPWLRPGIVARSALVERLLAASAGSVVCVVAPPGYGKMTLLAQWPSARATGSAGSRSTHTTTTRRCC